MDSVIKHFTDAHNELMEATGWRDMLANITASVKSAPSFVDDALAHVNAFAAAINWSEPFFLYLAAFHIIVILVVAYVTLMRPCSEERLLLISFLVLGLAFAMYPLNRIGGAYADRLFVEEVNYFDEGGLFMSILFWLPLAMLACWLHLRIIWRALKMMIVLKRTQLRHAAKQTKKND